MHISLRLLILTRRLNRCAREAVVSRKYLLDPDQAMFMEAPYAILEGEDPEQKLDNRGAFPSK